MNAAYGQRMEMVLEMLKSARHRYTVRLIRDIWAGDTRHAFASHKKGPPNARGDEFTSLRTMTLVKEMGPAKLA